MWFGEPHPFPERGSPTRLARRDNTVTKTDRVEWETEKLLHSILFFLLPFHFLTDYEISAKMLSLQKQFLSEDLDQSLKPQSCRECTIELFFTERQN